MEERQNERRRRKKMSWFKRGGNLFVVFIPATPGVELKMWFEKR